jgi:hypothetical protein
MCISKILGQPEDGQRLSDTFINLELDPEKRQQALSILITSMKTQAAPADFVEAISILDSEMMSLATLSELKKNDDYSSNI